jgi:hypothetical protein
MRTVTFQGVRSLALRALSCAEFGDFSGLLLDIFENMLPVKTLVMELLSIQLSNRMNTKQTLKATTQSRVWTSRSVSFIERE